MTNAYDKLKRFFAGNRGRTVTGNELHEVAGIQTYPRRIRELRHEGWPILTNNDVVDLKPGEYRMDSEPPTDAHEPSKRLSQRLRAEVFERDSSICQMCGAVGGEPDEDNPGRPIRLHVGHIVDKSHDGTDVITNLRTLCSACNQGSKNLTAEPPRHTWLMAQVRKAAIDDQRRVFEWLRERLGE